MIDRLAIAGYRSLRKVTIALGRITVVTGANGSGKSSLYRSLRLLSEAAQARLIASVAAEGGLVSTLWAGPEKFSRGMKDGSTPVQGLRRSEPVALKLGFSSDTLGYAIDLGLPGPSAASSFPHDPEIKVEALWNGHTLSPRDLIAERRGPGVQVRRQDTGEWRRVSTTIAPFDSMMTQCADPVDGLELLMLREQMRGWRFYDDLRTDRHAPARRPQVGTFTPVLSADGGDLGSALQTILAIGDRAGLAEAVADAFDGATIDVNETFEVEMRQHGLLRPLRAAELSEGTLRYLLLAAALLSPRPPELMVLNEPEASLHPDLIPPLARLLAHAAKASQIMIVSHAEALVETLIEERDATHILLEKQLGETIVADADPVDWTWPKR
ncbi:AAA family ATPase [Sphingomonas immobilis]|uniref:AAA family ATPase n=1 Tax=Sphingomonas immobilis TaxID=3063997 RepID=A0ABT8ZYQ6_9SPHN|nr:AAA family ATPase [Sphingomonas sp. CA1-15]MDO7842712.1 AAA family ATPase [Sphingomonas sp. CA1-15]